MLEAAPGAASAGTGGRSKPEVGGQSDESESEIVMSKQDEEIKKKLMELEASLPEETIQPPAVRPANTEVSKPTDSVESDLYLVIGFGLLLTGIFLFMHHAQLVAPVSSWLGFGSPGFGLILLPLLLGLGFVFYDYQNRVGWVLTAASCALIFFAVLSQLVMYFPSMTLLGVMIMLLPLAAGGALIAKGLKSRKKTGN